MKKILAVLLLLFTIPIFAVSYDIIRKPVGHKKVMDRTEVQKLFGMYITRWDDNTPVTVVLLPFEDPMHKQFVRNILRVSPTRYRRHLEKIINGEGGVSMVKARNFKHAIEIVKNSQGSIGYSDSYLVAQFGGSNVEIIQIR